MKHKWFVASVLIIVEVALCAGIIYISWASISWASAGLASAAGINLRIFSLDRISSQASEEQRFAVTGPASLNVQNLNGNVSIAAAATQEIVVQAYKTAWGSTQAEADAKLAKLSVEMTQHGDTLDVQVMGVSDVVLLGSSRESSVAFTITVPAQIGVTVSNRVGRLSLSGTTGAAKLKSTFGAIEVSAVTGTLSAETSNGTLSAQGLQGDDVSLSNSFGNIELSDSRTGRLTVSGRNGKITARRVHASDVAMTSDFGGIDFEDGSADGFNVTARNGGVRLAGLTLRGPLAAHSDFGDLTLTGTAAGSYDLSSQNGAVRVDGANGPVKAHSDFGPIDITNGSGVVLDLVNRNGDVSFSGSLAQASQSVKSDFGAVRLSLPRNSALNLDLQTDFGAISSDFPVVVSGAANAKRVRGPINGGGANLNVSTKNGSISLIAFK